MPEKLVHNSEYARVYYDPERKMVRHEFLKYISGQALRDALNAGLDALEDNRAQKWLSDDRGNNALSDDDDKWTSTVWFPRALKAGFKYWAIVLPEKFAGQANMKRRAAALEAVGVTVKAFSDPEAARKWLESI